VLLITRRGFILKASLGAVAIPFSSSLLSASVKGSELIFSARSLGDGKHFVSCTDFSGKVVTEIPVGHRCHSVVCHPRRPYLAVVFPRRPGYVAYVVDFRSGEVVTQLHAQPGRFFYGHGTFSQDGSTLFATENDYSNRAGCISLWDGTSFGYLGKYSSQGVGPHEVVLSHDGRTLIVANSGELDSPESHGGRKALNAGALESSLSFIDVVTGNGNETLRLPPHEKHLSMRHLSVTSDNYLAIALQRDESLSGSVSSTTPIFAVYSPRTGLETITAPPPILDTIKGYALSVTINPVEKIACVTCSRGNVVTFWDLSHRQFLRATSVPDPGGACFIEVSKSFLVTCGSSGELMWFCAQTGELTRRISGEGGYSWDNHFTLATSALYSQKG
jgi:uncharacterized protein